MSIRLGLDEIAVELAGRWGYLIVAPDPLAPAKVVALSVDVRDGHLCFDAGSGGLFHAASRGGSATFVVPPLGVGEFGTYSLVIDGEVRVDGDLVVVEPATAVWHRPAPTVSS